MHDEWRQIIGAEMEKEAEEIMKEVNSDPALKDVQAPPEIREALLQQIQEYEKQKIYDQLTDEDRELIQLGKCYKKTRKLGRYLVIAMAIVFILAMGSVSVGKGKNISRVISRMFAGREQTVTGSEDTNLNIYNEEGEIYEKIEKTYGFLPVKLIYLPDKTVFYEGVLGKDIQGVNLIYEMKNGSSIIYIIRPEYRDGSIATDIEDKKVQEYQMTVNCVEVTVTEYIIEESGVQKWAARFVYEDVLYLLRVTDIEQKEMEKIINNLHFFK